MNDRNPMRHDSPRPRRRPNLSIDPRADGRRRPRCRPRAEGLEGRSLLSLAGGPDLSFGTNSNAYYPNNFYPFATVQAFTASATQPNGDLVVVGEDNGYPPFGYNLGFYAIRLGPDGGADPLFSSAAMYLAPSLQTYALPALGSPIPSFAGATGVAIEPGGQIVVVGNSTGSTTPGAPLAARAVLLNADGTLDTSFGDGGIVTLGTVGGGDSTLDYASAVTILPGGRIAVAGATEPTAGGRDTPAVEVLNLDGSVDTSYGTNGVATVPLPTNAGAFAPVASAFVTTTEGGVTATASVKAGPVELVHEADGGVVIAANAVVPGSPPAVENGLTRLTAAGAPDTSFGTDGQVTIAGPSVFPVATGVSGTTLATDPAGDLIFGGGVFLPGVPSYRMVVERLTAAGPLDTTFGVGGINILPAPTGLGETVGAIAVQPDGKLVIADQVLGDFTRLNPDGSLDISFGTAGQSFDFGGGSTDIIRRGHPSGYPLPEGAVGLTIAAGGRIIEVAEDDHLHALLGRGAPSDLDGDGISDPAVYDPSGGSAYDPNSGAFTYVPSSGAAVTTLDLFFSHPDQYLPAPGAYGGEGIDELGLYDQATGMFYIESLHGSFADMANVVQFGVIGVGQSLPAPGDYDRSGATELAIYDPTTGVYAYRPADGGKDVYTFIGTPGSGAIPAPGDYFGTGQDDVAVYDPKAGSFIIQDPSSGQLETIPFGPAGAGAIPEPGDYDGSGLADLAVYLPGQAEFMYGSAAGGPVTTVPFGVAGPGMTVPAPGDYNGSGKTEVAGYVPSTGTFSYLPAGGGPAVSKTIGTPNLSIPYTLASETLYGGNPPGPAVSAESVAGPAEIPLTPDVLDSLAGPGLKKKSGPA